jgi:hypothetical protein
MILPHTSNALRQAGHNPLPLEAAAARAFTSAQSASTNTVQLFWNAFCAAHNVLYRRPNEQRKAA